MQNLINFKQERYMYIDVEENANVMNSSFLDATVRWHLLYIFLLNFEVKMPDIDRRKLNQAQKDISSGVNGE